jgi:hypothetical protein
VQLTLERAETHSHYLSDRSKEQEPASWTPPQRCVWRSAIKTPEPQRWEIVHDRSLDPLMRAFVSINQGRWIVTCPFPGCSSAQMASHTDRRFWCVDCENKASGSRWVEVIWPDQPTDIEGWLTKRPATAKNWVPGETGDDIAKQDILWLETQKNKV